MAEYLRPQAGQAQIQSSTLPRDEDGDFHSSGTWRAGRHGRFMAGFLYHSPAL
jgi:hypothetical protein